MALSKNALVLISLSVGLLSAVLVFHFLVKDKARTARTPQRISIVVTTHPIAARTVIDAADVREIFRPTASVPENCAASVSEIIGQVALSSLDVGEPVTRSAVTPLTASLGLAFAVPVGMRAVAISLDPIIGVAGFLKPGDRVDVVSTFKVDELEVTKTVLQDVTLLAIGSEMQSGEEGAPADGKSPRPHDESNAILAVTPAEAEALILAEASGRLRLTLRSTEDQARVALRGVRSDTLSGMRPYRPISAPTVRSRQPRIDVPAVQVAKQTRGTKTGTVPRDQAATAAALTAPNTSNQTGAARSIQRIASPENDNSDECDTQSVETIRGTEKTIVQVPVLNPENSEPQQKIEQQQGMVLQQETVIEQEEVSPIDSPEPALHSPEGLCAAEPALDPTRGTDVSIKPVDAVDVMTNPTMEEPEVTETVLHDTASLPVKPEACSAEQISLSVTNVSPQDSFSVIQDETPSETEVCTQAKASGQQNCILRYHEVQQDTPLAQAHSGVSTGTQITQPPWDQMVPSILVVTTSSPQAFAHPERDSTEINNARNAETFHNALVLSRRVPVETTPELLRPAATQIFGEPTSGASSQTSSLHRSEE